MVSQCMASCFFLLKQFEDVLVYLKSIKAYFTNDDDFNWNYGITCANVGEHKEAKEAYLDLLFSTVSAFTDGTAAGREVFRQTIQTRRTIKQSTQTSLTL